MPWVTATMTATSSTFKPPAAARDCCSEEKSSDKELNSVMVSRRESPRRRYHERSGEVSNHYGHLCFLCFHRSLPTFHEVVTNSLHMHGGTLQGTQNIC